MSGKVGKGFGLWVEHVDITSLGNSPDSPVPVQFDLVEPGKGERGASVGVGLKQFEPVPIVTTKPIASSDPDKALLILKNTGHKGLG